YSISSVAGWTLVPLRRERNALSTARLDVSHPTDDIRCLAWQRLLPGTSLSNAFGRRHGGHRELVGQQPHESRKVLAQSRHCHRNCRRRCGHGSSGTAAVISGRLRRISAETTY